MTDWNPNDPEATIVHYDLSAWSFDQQAELASELADAAVQHTWDGTELLVPEEAEAQADSAIASVELRLGIDSSDDDRNDGSDDDAGNSTADDGDRSVVDGWAPAELLPIALGADVATTEFQLDEWTSTERDKVTRGLSDRQVPFRWDDTLLLVPTADETEVEVLLDLVEQGLDHGGHSPEGDEAERLPFETLTTFFLAGERLRKDPMDAEGLRQLVNATEVADPEHPPYGVDARLWSRTCELADEVADALAGEAEPDVDTAQQAAEDLHDLLRPYV